MKGKNRKIIRRISLTLGSIFIIFIVGFYIYASDYYEAQEEAKSIIMEGENIKTRDNLRTFYPEGETNIGLIFYPGAKVESIAYAPLLDKIRSEGIMTVLVEMPFNMAIFNTRAADKIFDLYPEVESWYIGGHSMGGAMASRYASQNKEKLEGLILLGAYIYGDYSPEDSLTIYGTLNANLEDNIDYKENIVIIEGGNHAQFGNYGEQRGDPKGEISWEKQQAITVDAITSFIRDREK